MLFDPQATAERFLKRLKGVTITPTTEIVFIHHREDWKTFQPLPDYIQVIPSLAEVATDNHKSNIPDAYNVGHIENIIRVNIARLPVGRPGYGTVGKKRKRLVRVIGVDMEIHHDGYKK